MGRNIINWKKLVKAMPPAYSEWFDAEKEFYQKEVKKNSRVLEVGCGDGRSLKDLFEITKNLTGIDNDPIAVKYAKTNFKDVSSIKIILAEAETLPFEDDSFDVVTCIGTFANFGEKKKAILKEMKRVVRKDGFIIISVYSEDALAERLKMYRLIAKDKVREIREDGTVMFAWNSSDNISEQFSKEKLTALFQDVGLKPVLLKKVKIAYLCKLSK